MLRSDRPSEGRSGSAASVVGPSRSFATAALPRAPSTQPSFGPHDLHAMTDKTVTHEYADVLERDAKCYRARATGRIRSDGMWEGWIEFVDLAEDERVRTDIETMQSNERSFRHWAAGVGPAYLEGAFSRATSRAAEGSMRPVPPLSPLPRRSVLDPFEVDAQGEGVLAARLSAFDLDRIRDIALAYELVPPKTGGFATRAELIVEILATVSTARREPGGALGSPEHRRSSRLAPVLLPPWASPLE